MLPKRKPFLASSWLLRPKTDIFFSGSEDLKRREPPILAPPNANPFLLGKFLVPGWKGESLFSRPANLIKKVQEELWKDALSQFKGLDNLNSSFKQAIYNEYLDIAKTLNPQRLCEQTEFWKHLNWKHSPFKHHLKKFVEIYTFRTATVYLYRLMFVAHLSDALSLKLQERDLRSPHSLISRLFKTGSSNELKCRSLKQNLYSWYHPGASLFSRIKTLEKNFKHLSIGQLMKLSTYRGLEKTCKQFDFFDQQYSHALSHRGFGLFMDGLLTFFPQWLKNKTSASPLPGKKQFPKTLNVRFVGDRIDSISHGYWLAQECSLKTSRHQILCPDFCGEEPESHSFVKICHELQLLSFLVKFGRNQGLPIKEFLCSVMKKKYRLPKTHEGQQIPLFNGNTDSKLPVYDRIVLTLTNLPAKNPHHCLVQKIYEQESSLSHRGHLYIFTNQKLFVPSQSSKIQQLLKKFEMEAFFDLGRLKGKGEVANYVYILKKRLPTRKAFEAAEFAPPESARISELQQEPCLNFRYSGELHRFGKFESLVATLQSFFRERGQQQTSLYSKPIDDNLSFEFHQDAIIEGKLLSSTSKDGNNITHPNFFKKLTQNCIPLEHFFHIENIHEEDSVKNLPSDFLGINLRKENLFSYVLIADYRDPKLVRLEIAPFEAYKGKREQYGIAFFQYFGLSEKLPSANINLFREFFESDLGTQVIQLSLNGGPTKIKSKLKTLLIPGFFAKRDNFAFSLQENLEIFKLTGDEILSLHPHRVREQTQKALAILEKYGWDSPWMTLGLIGHFKFNLLKVNDRLRDGSEEINYSNPLILNPLLALTGRPLLHNEDVFLECLVGDQKDYLRPLALTKLQAHKENFCLKLYSEEKAVVELYSDAQFLKFVDFLLCSARGRPIGQILGELQLPRLGELKSVLDEFDLVKQVCHQGLCDAETFIQKFFNKVLITS